MDNLFNPTSVALIGASRHPDKLGYQILNNLIKSGYLGKIYPINPEAREILGLQSFPSVKNIPQEIDLALIIVPAIRVESVLRECVEKKVPNAVIISAGFSEIGQKGQEIQEKIRALIEEYPIRVVGPNCLGVINSENNLNLTFAAPQITKGNVSVVFQSGALGVALLDLAQKYEFGFSKFISLGNKVDIEESEILDYLAEDDLTKVVALYLEEISHPDKFFFRAQKASRKKPIVILKGGTTAMGARAAFSHTAAMISPQHINHALFSQANLLEAKTLEEMLNLISLLSCEPPIIKKNLAIITNAGGPGILATDVAAKNGFSLPKPDNKFFRGQNALQNIASVNNPLDLTGGATAKEYEIALNYCRQDKDIAEILVLLTPQTSTEIEKTAEVIVKGAAAKPTIASFLGDKTVEKGIEILKRKRTPHFEEPEEAISALSKVARYWQKKEMSFSPIETMSKIDKSSWQNPPPLELVNQYHIPVAQGKIVNDLEAAIATFNQIQAPVAIKSASPEVVHKTREGKVALNVYSEDQLKKTISKIGYPALVQEMIDLPLEIIVGAKRDSSLGTILTFGWGGIFTEDLEDIATRIFPLTENDLDEMIKETKIGKLVLREKINLENIKNIVKTVGQIMNDYPEIYELDLNPIKVGIDKAICVDARYK